MKPILLVVTAIAVSAPVFAQDNEIAFQFGKVFSEGRRFTAENAADQILSEDNGYAGGIVYNRRLVGGDIASLQFHLPFFFFENKFNNAAFLGNNISDTTSITGFVTPGLQVRFLEPFPIQPYAFAGVGYAHVARLTPREGLDDVDFDHTGTWGVSAGGGVDVMFGENFGIRGEVRSLSTGGRNQVVPGLLLDDPTTRWGATGGIVLRF